MPELSGWIEVFFLLLALGLMVWIAYRLWSRSSSPVMKVLARVPLEPRRTLYIVEVAGQCLLIGAGEGGLSTLATLEPERVRASLEEARRGEKPLLVTLMEMIKRKEQDNK
jgi:flagellar biogenesis protein FliO